MTTPPQTTTTPSTTKFDIMKTADDAVRVKAAAVDSGYYDDPYVNEFVSMRMVDATTVAVGGAQHQHHPPHRPHRPVHVIIKRGTFARVQCVERVIRCFLHQALEAAAATDEDDDADEGDEKGGRGTTSDKKERHDGTPQVVLLGAGKDTALFRLRDDEVFGSEAVRWFEVDQEEMIRQKVSVLMNRRDVFHTHGLSRLAATDDRESGDGQNDHGGIVKTTKEIYMLPKTSSSSTGSDWSAHFIVHDFIEDRTTDLMAALVQQCGMQPHAPTLVITECVQMYLPVTAVDGLMRHFLGANNNDDGGDDDDVRLTNVTVCSYEPILQSDVFGSVMETNLRNSHLLTDDAACVLLQRRTIGDLLAALRAAGATLGVGTDMKTAYETVLTKSQQERARRCEFLDELEEWHLIMQHYCLIVATSDANGPIGRALCGRASTVGFPDHDPNVHRFGTL